MSARRALRETSVSIRGCPFTIAHLSDLHDRPFDAAAESLRRSRPDIICVTGDFVNARRRPEEEVAANARFILPFFEMCSGIAPVFVSLGNHEWMLTESDMRRIRGTGVTVLDDRYVLYRGAVIGGLSSSLVSRYRSEVVNAGLSERFPYPGAAGITSRMEPDLSVLDGFCSQEGYRILLCHHPEYYERYLSGREFSLVLSGHAHGGQIRLFGRGLYAPGQGILPKLTEGVHFGRLIVSRGLSNNSIVPRVFNPPEIVYIRPEN